MTKEVLFGDCGQLLSTCLADDSVDLILTSPPYANQRKGVYDGIDPDKFVEWFLPIAREIKRVMKPTGSFFLNINPHIQNGEVHLYVHELVIAMRKELGFTFVDEYAWVKQGYPGNYQGYPGNYQGRFKNAWEPVFHFTKANPSTITFNPLACGTPVKPESYKRYLRKQHSAPESGSGMAPMNMSRIIKDTMARPSNVLQIGVGNNQYSYQKNHPATFPEKFAEFFILSFSNPGQVILDPFAGSGTTGRVAWQNGRGFILIEKKEDYYNQLREWSSNLTFQSNLLLQ